KGYYTLDLRAGFSNYTSSQDIKGKWVTFTLPDGVNVADDLPNGVTSVYIAGKTGIAVKVPDIEGIGSETVQKQIPLTGEDTDNDPVYNLYMVDVDVDAGQYEEIGQVNAQRDIDFSVMDENPALELSGSINGTASFNEERGK